MSINGGKASNALGGKTARACDSCLIKRARWFCAADDAFLCQSCDGAVHSANQLASRHDRVRLETSSCKASPAPAPAWHTKKARTPRSGKPSRTAASNHQLPVVPELGSDDPFPAEENDEQLFCRVPEFDGGEFCKEMVKGEELGFEMSMVFDDDRELNLDELLSSCDDDFAADVETLLGTGIDGLLDEKTVKIEENRDEIDEEIARHFDPELDAELNWDFDCATNSPIGEETRDADTVKTGSNAEMENESKKLLRLNYEAVIAAWATQSNSNSPWTDGIRPQFDLDLVMSSCLDEEWGGGKRERDAGREARVSRYREKRRTRLFSKKIRYEVRKLNAEKRPRMKGRFVKRTAFLGTSSSSLPFHHLITK